MTPLFNEILILNSKKFQFKKEGNLMACADCEFSRNSEIFMCSPPVKFGNWDCRYVSINTQGFYTKYDTRV